MTQAATPSENLSLRARPPNPKRLSRKVLLTGAATLGLVIAFALLTGLSDRPERLSAASAEASPVAATTLPDAISRIPVSYSAAARRDTLTEPRDMMFGDHGRPGGYEDSAELALAEDDYWASETGSGYGYSNATSRSGAEPAEPEPPPAPIFFEQRRDAHLSRASSFERGVAEVPASRGGAGDQAAPHGREEASAYHPPSSPYELQAGTVIPAALVTAINSDLPGRVMAHVTAPVFDTVTGNHLLIPQGARLIGTYSSETVYGDTRVFLKWDRLLMPNGWSLDLGAMEATDPTGASGLTDKTDNHLDRLGGAIALSAVLSILANEAEDDETQGFTRSVGDAAAQEAARAGGRIVDRDLNLKPTLRVRPGAPVRVLVTEDLLLGPYGD